MTTKKPDLERIVQRLELDTTWNRKKDHDLELSYREYFKGTLLETWTAHFDVALYGGKYHRSCNCGTDDWDCTCDTADKPYYRLVLTHKATGEVVLDEKAADGKLKALYETVDAYISDRQQVALADDFGEYGRDDGERVSRR